MAGKSTRITVDLGNESLVKTVRIAAVEQGRTVRDIVVEALNLWLAANASQQVGSRGDAHSPRDGAPADDASLSSSDKDYLTMMENLNRYRGAGQE